MTSAQISARRAKMAEEAIAALTAKPVVTYSAERVRLWSAIADEVAHIDGQPGKLGHGLTAFLSRVSVPVEQDDRLVGRMTEESFTPEEEEAFRARYITDKMRFEGIPKFLVDGGHQSFLWDDLIHTGLPGLKARAEERLAEAEDGGTAAEREFLRSVILIYDAFIAYLRRSAEAAEAAGAHDAAKACYEAAEGAPASFHAALQLIWTVEFVFCAYISPNPTLTVGRLDLFLIDLYRADLASGVLDEERARLLIAEFYAKNNLIMGRGEHQISDREHSPMCTGWHRILCYDAPQYLILSGTDPDSGLPICNELTAMMIEEIHPKYKNPVIVFRYTKEFANDHPDLWKTLIAKMRDSGSIMIYNDISVCAMYKHYGESDRDAYAHEFYGCNWPTIPGKDMSVYAPFHFGFERCLIPFVMLAARAYCAGKSQVEREGLLTAVYETLKPAFRDQLNYYLPKANEPNPHNLRVYCCFTKESIEAAGEYYSNRNIIVPMGSICTAIDILTAVEYLINEKKITPDRLFAGCDSEFADDPVLLALCKNAPKMGDGNAISAYYARELTYAVIRACEDGTADRPDFLKLRFCAENDTWHLERGDELGATPDGRRRGEPIAQNCQPAAGAAQKGLTAMLTSLADIPFDRFASGALNVTVQPSNFGGEAGLANLAAILSTYLEMGGLQIQLSGVDRELLIEAQNDPDRHRDLMVRVTGYSAVFVDMCKKAQDDLISRNTF